MLCLVGMVGECVVLSFLEGCMFVVNIVFEIC